MGTKPRVAALVIVLIASLPIVSWAAPKQFRYTLAPGGSVSVVNEYGRVTLKPSAGRQVIITATPSSDKVEVDCAQNGNRVEVRSHFLQRASQQEGQVDYDIQVPPDTTISVRTGSGPVHVEKLRGDVTLEGDGAAIEVRDLSGALVHARTVSGPITLNNVVSGHVELSSVTGNVSLTNVTGPKVTVNTTKGAIAYTGNCAGGGEYSLTNHSGNIDIALPADASVDLTARSINGKVQNEFPFQPKAHASFPVEQGHSFAGTSNSGASVLRLRSFTGTITVKKQ